MLDAALSVTFTPSFSPSAIFPDLIRRMISLAVSMKILSTLYPVFADVSINSSPFSFANRSPSAYDTTFSSSFTSLLFLPLTRRRRTHPTSVITMFGLVLLHCTADSHDCSFSYDCLFVMSYTRIAAAASR